jgi:hypothetical protein
VEPVQVRVTLDLEVGATPISGSLRREHDVAHRFDGWIELASLIDVAAHAQGPAVDSPAIRAGARAP